MNPLNLLRPRTVPPGAPASPTARLDRIVDRQREISTRETLARLSLQASDARPEEVTVPLYDAEVFRNGEQPA